jgi:excisionase family DNA binding protein
MNDEYLRPSQLAAALGISVRTLCRWNLERKAPPRIRVGRVVLYRREAVEVWLRKKENGSVGASV